MVSARSFSSAMPEARSPRAASDTDGGRQGAGRGAAEAGALGHRKVLLAGQFLHGGELLLAPAEPAPGFVQGLGEFGEGSLEPLLLLAEEVVAPEEIARPSGHEKDTHGAGHDEPGGSPCNGEVPPDLEPFEDAVVNLLPVLADDHDVVALTLHSPSFAGPVAGVPPGGTDTTRSEFKLPFLGRPCQVGTSPLTS